MSDPIAFHFITREQLQSGLAYAAWNDLDSIAATHPARLRALLDNPLAKNPAEPAQILAVRQNEIVGRIDLIPGLIHSPAGELRVFWCSNLYVPPRHRNTLTGLLLIMKSQQVPGTVGAFGPSQMALPIYQKLKWLDHPIPRYILVRRSRSVVERYARPGPHAKVLSVLADGVLGLHRLLQAPFRVLRTRGLRVEHASAVPAELDPILTTPREGVAVHRSAAFINWWLTHRFKDDPRDRNDLYLVRNRDGAVVAYFLNKIRFYESATHRQFKNLLLGSIQDWMVLDRAAVNERSLIVLATRELLRQGVDAIELCTGDQSLRGLIRRMGFLRVGHLHLMVRPMPGSPLATIPGADLSKWWIRPGDGDNFLS